MKKTITLFYFFLLCSCQTIPHYSLEEKKFWRSFRDECLQQNIENINFDFAKFNSKTLKLLFYDSCKKCLKKIVLPIHIDKSMVKKEYIIYKKEKTVFIYFDDNSGLCFSFDKGVYSKNISSLRFYTYNRKNT